MKKCPACNSTKIIKSISGFKCKRCGYTNKIKSLKETNARTQQK